MSRFILTSVLVLLVSFKINAQNIITIDSVFVGTISYIYEERLFDENIGDSTYIVNLSSHMKPQIVIFMHCDSIGNKGDGDFFCEFKYNGKDYSLEMGTFSLNTETASIVFRESHIFDNVLYVEPIDGVIDYFYPILQIMESFKIKFIDNRKKVFYSRHPKILVLH